MRKSKLLIAAPILSAVLLLAGCGSDSEDTDSGAATAAATEEATEEATEDAAEVNTDKADAIVAAATAVIDAAKLIPSTSDLGEPIDIS